MAKRNFGWETFIDNNLDDRTAEKFSLLSRFYKSTDGILRYTNVEDAVGSIKQVEWIAIAELLQEGKVAAGGYALTQALTRILRDEAEVELMDEYEANIASGKEEAEAAADMRYQRQRDDKLMEA